MNWPSRLPLSVVYCLDSPILILTLLTWFQYGCHFIMGAWFIDGFCLTDSSQNLLLWLFFHDLCFHQVQVSWTILNKLELCQEGLILESIFSQWKFPSYGLLAHVDCIFCWNLPANILISCWAYDLELAFISKIIYGLWAKLWAWVDIRREGERGQGREKNGGCREGEAHRDGETAMRLWQVLLVLLASLLLTFHQAQNVLRSV